ncbi:MAG TPA: RIP metalloprotease RseP [Chloroflexi bacterium]|jgi:regulator of sigma E protease|nr:RIP metalloprotease RseP [Chloroflexota bacterium]
MGLISFVAVFGLLVLAHELGHFVVAKLAGVKVDEFGFGFPPRLVTLGTWRGTNITINAIPIGGFVRMSEDDPSVEGSLARKGRATRALVFVSGALMNVVLAAVLFTITFMLGTLVPVADAPGAGVYLVAPGSPAEMAGLRPGDTILSIDGQPVDDVERAIELTQDNLGRAIAITVERDGQVLPTMTATPREHPPENEGALGVALDAPLQRRAYPVWEALPKGIAATWGGIRGIVGSLIAAIRRQLPFQVTGVIGIYNLTTEVAQSGLSQLLEFTGLLSLNLFLFNLLPLPALDGGRLIFVLLEWLRGGRRVPPEKEGAVHAVGMVLLLALMVVVAVIDYMRYFG